MINQSDSRVEVKGIEARFYDRFMDILTFGTYPFFIRNAIKSMNINNADNILELGSGSGRNICFMNKYTDGEIVGLDIGKIMLNRSRKRCKKYQNIEIKEQSIIDEIPYKNKFDKILISFVFHGFIQENRLKILKNVISALKPKGKFFILDYSEMQLKNKSGFTRFFFNKVECPLAEDYVERNWIDILGQQGFDKFEEKYYYKKLVRLLSCEKK